MISHLTITISCIFGFVCGMCLCKIVYDKYFKVKQKQQLKNAAGVNEDNIGKNFCSDGLAYKVLCYLIKLSFQKSQFKFTKSKMFKEKQKKLVHLSNMPESFDIVAYREAQVKFAISFGIIGLVIGLIFSSILSALLFLTGFLLGLRLPGWAMKQEAQNRTIQLEKNLPEMLEVVSLGLRSGLTFDRSLKIYTSHFDNSFSKACKFSQLKWESGIDSREESLIKLSDAYDSFLFKKVIENIIRSIRFGSSMVDSLEEAAIEARNIYKSKLEEKVAKAPVKMMIPTGTLILPAMLLLVLGPILLNLIGGF